MNRRFAVAVTGGVASGKSAVTDRFTALGIEVADADLAARDAVAVGSPGLAQIVALWGPSVLDAYGGLDRAAMRKRIFADDVAKRQLEAIVHPEVRRLLERQRDQVESAYAVVAIPLLAEVGGRRAYPWLDRILVVDVDRSTQLDRLLQRDQVSPELAERMISAQASRSERLAIADDILRNDGSLAELDQAVAELDALYRRLAADARP